MKAVESTKYSQRLWLLWLQVDGSTEESQTAALVASGRLFGRESTAALKWSALRKRVRRRLGLEEWSTLRKRLDSGSFQQIRRERIPWDHQVCWIWFVGSVSTFRGLGQLVKRPLYAQRKRVISSPISKIVNEIANGVSKEGQVRRSWWRRFRNKVVNFSNLLAWLF